MNLTLEMTNQFMNEIAIQDATEEKNKIDLFKAAKDRFECLKDVFKTILIKRTILGKHYPVLIPLEIGYYYNSTRDSVEVFLYIKKHKKEGWQDHCIYQSHNFTITELSSDEKFKEAASVFLRIYARSYKSVMKDNNFTV